MPDEVIKQLLSSMIKKLDDNNLQDQKAALLWIQLQLDDDDISEDARKSALEELKATLQLLDIAPPDKSGILVLIQYLEEALENALNKIQQNEEIDDISELDENEEDEEEELETKAMTQEEIYGQRLCQLLEKPHPDRKVLETYISSGASLSYKMPGTQNTALHIACGTTGAKPDPVIIKMLIDQNADINAQNSLGRTPLHIAAQNYDIATYNLLKKYGADDDIPEKSKSQFSPSELLAHVEQRQRKALQSGLLEAIANNAEYGKFKERLNLLLSFEKNSYFEKTAGNLDFVDNHGLSPVHYAIKLGNTELLKVLIDNGANVNSNNKKMNDLVDRALPLHYAIAMNDAHAVKLLLDVGADPTQTLENSTINLPSPYEFANQLARLDPSLMRIASLIKHNAFSRDQTLALQKQSATPELEEPPSWLSHPPLWLLNIVGKNKTLSKHIDTLALTNKLIGVRETLLKSMEGDEKYKAWVDSQDEEHQDILSQFAEEFRKELNNVVRTDWAKEGVAEFYDALYRLASSPAQMNRLLTLNPGLNMFLKAELAFISDIQDDYQSSQPTQTLCVDNPSKVLQYAKQFYEDKNYEQLTNLIQLAVFQAQLPEIERDNKWHLSKTDIVTLNYMIREAMEPLKRETAEYKMRKLKQYKQEIKDFKREMGEYKLDSLEYILKSDEHKEKLGKEEKLENEYIEKLPEYEIKSAEYKALVEQFNKFNNCFITPYTRNIIYSELSRSIKDDIKIIAKPDNLQPFQQAIETMKEDKVKKEKRKI